jgi:hypothetical protein
VLFFLLRDITVEISVFRLEQLTKVDERKKMGDNGLHAIKMGGGGVQAVKMSGYGAQAGKMSGYGVKAIKMGGQGVKAVKMGGCGYKVGSDGIPVIKMNGDVLREIFKGGGQALEAGNATVNVVKSVSTFAIAASVASVALTVVDVALLVRGWALDHPTIEILNNVKTQLKQELERFENLQSTIDTFKEKAYVSTLDDILIVSSTTIFNNALIALLNNDVAKCIEILKQHEIDWPFDNHYSRKQMAHFILNQGIASGFDEYEVENIINKTDKKAQQAILTLLKNITNEVARRQEEVLDDDSDDERHNRGEHVINNSVLCVHKYIIDLFLQYQFDTTFEAVIARIGKDSQIYKDYHHPLPDHIKENIQYRMVANIPDDYQYFDVNALSYGILIKSLGKSATLYMSDLYNDQHAEGSQSTEHIRVAISQINFLQTYVEQIAKTYWLTHQGGDWVTYENSSIAVQAMFQNLYNKFRDWILELRRAGY